MSKKGVLNIYKTNQIKKNLNDKYDMGGFEDHHITFPEHMAIFSATSGGKTNLLYNYLMLSSKNCGTFGHITVVCKSMEPIYELLKKELGDNLTIYLSLRDLPHLDDLGNNDVQQCVVMDDCVGDKDQSKIEQYYLRSRKFGKGVQCIYLSQSYTKTPSFLRNQISYALFLSLSSDKDLNNIMQNYNVGADKKVLKKIFKNAVSEKLCFFKIKTNTTDLNHKFSRNWDDFYTLLDEHNELITEKDIELFHDSGIVN